MQYSAVHMFGEIRLAAGHDWSSVLISQPHRLVLAHPALPRPNLASANCPTKYSPDQVTQVFNVVYLHPAPQCLQGCRSTKYPASLEQACTKHILQILAAF
ncbi:hypothetical protein ACJBU6_03028 [Exserohilum turcicum]